MTTITDTSTQVLPAQAPPLPAGTREIVAAIIFGTVTNRDLSKNPQDRARHAFALADMLLAESDTPADSTRPPGVVGFAPPDPADSHHPPGVRRGRRR